MRVSAKVLSGAVAVVVAVGFSASQAHANLSAALLPCQKIIAKAAQKYLKSVIKIKQKCNNANLKSPGSCTAPDSAKLTKAEGKLRSSIDKKCGGLSTSQIEDQNPFGLAFPGPCPDSDGGSFSLTNLEDCMLLRHGEKADEMLTEQYGSASGPLDTAVLKCQIGAAKAAAKFLSSKLKCLEKKCRSQLDLNRLTINPADCEIEPATAACIQKAVTKLDSGVSKKCTDTDIAALDICTSGSATVADAQQCLNQAHEDAANFLINIEHPAAPSCGDEVVNQPTEECDGTDDSACPGLCGASDGFFPCLCTNIPRSFNRYDQNADLETGWTGQSHDGKVVDGGGYFASISHCGDLGPNICLTGPACVATAQHCRDDSDCPGADTCVATQLRTLPHCADNAKEACRICNGGSRGGQLCLVDGDCPAGTCLSCTSGAECVFSFNGFPLPIAGGGTSVCVVDTLVEDVFGTVNKVTGESSEFLRENSKTFLSKSVPMPCPVCGGFCASAKGLAGLCWADSDCPTGDTCILSRVCNDGPNKGKPCSPLPPRGGPTAGFGSTSLDCPPDPGQNISDLGLDIAYDPFVTGVVTVSASFTCTNFKICAGNQSACTVDGDCPTGQVCKSICSGSLEPCTTSADCPGTETCDQKCAGTGEECLGVPDCPTGQLCTQPIRCFIAGQKRPNDCNAACIGGPDDGVQCSTGTDCSSLECRPAVCRLNARDPDNPGPKKCSVSLSTCTATSDCPSGETCNSLNPTEGECVAGPVFGECSLQKFRVCSSNADCQRPADGGTCPTCLPG